MNTRTRTEILEGFRKKVIEGRPIIGTIVKPSVGLSPEETALFQKQLGDVLGYVGQLSEVDVSHISLLGEADLKNQLRADVIAPSLTVAEALANAPKQENNLIVVPRMIESSTIRMFLPLNSELIALSFCLTDLLRSAWPGMMNVRPT